MKVRQVVTIIFITSFLLSIGKAMHGMLSEKLLNTLSEKEAQDLAKFWGYEYKPGMSDAEHLKLANEKLDEENKRREKLREKVKQIEELEASANKFIRESRALHEQGSPRTQTPLPDSYIYKQ